MTTDIQRCTGLNDQLAPHFVPRRYRPGDLGTWSGHLCFANDLIAALKPSLLVELGTHWGESYFTFCQSVFENQLDCVCYAVDHWLGEAHAGRYGEEVFESVHRYNETNYRSFSYLLRTSFDDALSQFGDSTIDLLHIDGLHTYEAVSHDFHNWWPKVRPGGVVLFHDIVVRHADFGVWRFWSELKSEFAETFEFHHWWGLGVLRKPGNSDSSAPSLDNLFRLSPADQERLRRYYVLNTSFLEELLATPDKTKTGFGGDSNTQVLRVYPSIDGNYSEEQSVAQDFKTAEFQELTLPLPFDLGDKPLRLDPIETIGLVEISSVAVKNVTTGASVWEANDSGSLGAIAIEGTAARVPNQDSLLILSVGDDPQCFLPTIPSTGEPLQLSIRLKVHGPLNSVIQLLRAAYRDRALPSKVSPSEEEIATLRRELQTSHAENALLIAENKELAAERKQAYRELNIANQAVAAARRRREQLEGDLKRTEGLLEHDRSVVAAMQRSLSWRVTDPLRRVMGLVRGGPRT